MEGAENGQGIAEEFCLVSADMGQQIGELESGAVLRVFVHRLQSDR